MTLTINATRVGGWGFSDVVIEAFAIPTTCEDACGFPGGLGRLAMIAVEFQTV